MGVKRVKAVLMKVVVVKLMVATTVEAVEVLKPVVEPMVMEWVVATRTAARVVIETMVLVLILALAVAKAVENRANGAEAKTVETKVRGQLMQMLSAGPQTAEPQDTRFDAACPALQRSKTFQTR